MCVVLCDNKNISPFQSSYVVKKWKTRNSKACGNVEHQIPATLTWTVADDHSKFGVYRMRFSALRISQISLLRIRVRVRAICQRWRGFS